MLCAISATESSEYLESRGGIGLYSEITDCAGDVCAYDDGGDGVVANEFELSYEASV